MSRVLRYFIIKKVFIEHDGYGAFRGVEGESQPGGVVTGQGRVARVGTLRNVFMLVGAGDIKCMV